jgi:hypothetical protein
MDMALARIFFRILVAIVQKALCLGVNCIPSIIHSILVFS